MADQFQTSFIPKKAYDAGPAPKKPSGALPNILSFIAIILLILSVVGAAGIFFYERYLESSLVSKKESLERARSQFEPELIRELSRLDAKFAIGSKLLAAHTAPSGVFDLLEDITLETVRFSSFSYALSEEGPLISLHGEALSFSSIALQSDEFGKNRSIREPAFSGMELDERGNVGFVVTAELDPTIVSYRERATGGGTALFEVDGAAGEVAGAGTTTIFGNL